LYQVFINEKLRLSAFFFLNFHSGEWNQGPLDTAATYWPIVLALGDYDNGEIGGMIGRGNRSTRRKPAPVLLCPPQTPHAAHTPTWATVGSQRLTAELRHGPASQLYCFSNIRWTYLML
jgi:hypothetical protein